MVASVGGGGGHVPLLPPLGSGTERPIYLSIYLSVRPPVCIHLSMYPSIKKNTVLTLSGKFNYFISSVLSDSCNVSLTIHFEYLHLV